MSKINILGIIKNIKSKSNIYTPIVEAVVNSIDAIKNEQDGKIDIIIFRENMIEFDIAKPYIKDIEIIDNGVGFDKTNRESFDTYLSNSKHDIGGKGFGRFMYLKYFNDVKIESQYKDENENYFFRKFRFGKKDEIIVDEIEGVSDIKQTGTKVILENILDKTQLEKGLDTIARKLVEKLLVFFVNDSFKTPLITLKESDNSESYILNDYINDTNSISKVGEKTFPIKSTLDDIKYEFQIKVYKIYYSSLTSRICLTAHNREVTETTLQTFIPEFQDEFYDIKNSTKRNYIIKAYVLGKYLNDNVSLERESFDFGKDVGDKYYALTQFDIEKESASIVKSFFEEDVKTRFEKKKERVRSYVNTQAPWHKTYLKDFDISDLPMTLSDERIEIEFQKFKFQKEQRIRIEVKEIFADDEAIVDEKLQRIFSIISNNGKNDLAHYVCNRKLIIDTFDELRKRRELDNKAHLEAELHNLIFPMGETSETIDYECHNLWLLDERLVFSQFIASDKIISKTEKKEPDLIIVEEEIRFYRNGENITSSPLTIFEFKRPKRTNYPDDENPIMQACRYADKIRKGKYEMPDGLEPIKVSDETPVYIYIVCDLCDKIHEFAKGFSLTLSSDGEGYFGYSGGFMAYIEIMSYRKVIYDAKMRNKIFFKKLGIE